MATPTRTRTTRLATFAGVFLLVLTALTYTGTAAAGVDESGDGSGPAPTITSDKADYHPGELVTLTGANWQPGESVHIWVDDDQTKSWERNVDVVADEDGNIVDEFSLPNWFVATYQVVATGEDSGTAVTTFTDSNPQAITVAAPTSVTIAQGGAAIYGNLTVSRTGNSNPCNVTLSTEAGGGTGLPSTTTPHWGANPVTVGASAVTTSFSVQTTSSTPPGTYTFRVTGEQSVPPGGQCSGNGPSDSNPLTLVVTPPAKAATAISDVSGSGPYAGTATLTATLKAGTTPLSGKTVGFTLDGSPVGSATTDATGVATLEDVSLAGYNADTYVGEVGASFAEDSTHLGSSGSGNLVAAKAPTTTTVSCPASVTYNGSALTPCSADVTGAGGLDQALTVSHTDNVEVGTATASASYAESANHLASSDSTTFEIEQAQQTITLVGVPASAVYGTSFTPTATSTSNLSVTITVSGACEMDEGVVTMTSGTGTCIVHANQPGDANHEAADEVSESVTAAKATATLSLSNLSHTYDGSPKEATVTTDPAGLGTVSVTYDASPTAPSAAGSYAVVASLDNPNYQAADASGTLVIDRASTSTTVTCQAGPFVYDGDPHEPCSAQVTGPGGLDETLTVSYQDNVDAGTATASANYPGGPNHEPSNDSASFEIDRADSTTTVTCEVGPFVYDGDPHEPCSAQVTGPGGLDETLTVSYQDNVDAGTATASANYPGGPNHEPSNDSASFEIDKAEATIVVTGFSGSYNGTARGATGSATSADGVTDLSILLSLGDSFTDVPGGTAHWTFAGDANHNEDSGSVEIEIGKAATTTTVTCQAGPFVYDGDPHEPCSAQVTGPGGLEETLTVSYQDNVNAGTANANAGYAGGPNHEPSTDSVTFTIAKRPIEITADPKSKQFGQPDPPLTWQLTGGSLVGSDTITGSLTRTAGGAVGTYPILQGTLTAGTNYKITFVGANLTIGAWHATGFYQPVGIPNSEFVTAPGAAPAVGASTVWNTAKGGSTIPLKFNLFTAEGGAERTSTSDVKNFQVFRLASCNGGGGDEQIEEFTSTGQTVLRYGDGQFIQNWATPKAGKDECYRVNVRFQDDSAIYAFVKLRK